MATILQASKKLKHVTPEELVNRCADYLPPERVDLVRKACDFAVWAHRGQTRLSGEPFVEHPINTALFLANLNLDSATLQAALLHDVIEDCNVGYDELVEQFGQEVSDLVNAVTKLSRLDLAPLGAGPSVKDQAKRDAGAESLRKMLVATASDVRVVLIKLADRLHNMKTLDVLPAKRRIAIAQETLDIYTPLAHRLGIWDLKWRLEDLAFRHLEPKRYRETSRLLSSKRNEREQYLTKARWILQTELDKAGVKAEVEGRPKHLYSIYQKMQKYHSQGKEFGQIFDLFALRVLVADAQDCYHALGVVHNLWHPLPGQFDDYIANPKDTLYQALHTAVRCLEGEPVEIQIRSYQMHYVAEYGVAAHWRYKNGDNQDTHFEEKMTWLRQLLEWQREANGTEEFLEGVKTDIFRDQVFVYTPKGDIKELPAGATPIDFAYRIHTDLGHRCIGAKINAELVPLDYQLQNGDMVEILITKSERGPTLDWLNPNLGYVRTANARERIRQWFNKQERGANIQRGRELLQKELKRFSLPLSEIQVAKDMKYDSIEDLFVAFGNGNLGIAQVVARFGAPTKHRSNKVSVILPEIPIQGIEILGVGDLLTTIALCCNPIPGDEIIGYITRARGVTVHKNNCPTIVRQEDKERVVSVNWSSSQPRYPVHLRVDACDHVGLLRDITTVVSDDKVNIASLVTNEHEDNTISIFLVLHTTGIGQLGRLLSRLEGVKGVVEATRIENDLRVDA
jgi:GTP pyrophosphokinase